MAENYDLIFGQGASSQYAWSDSDYQNGWKTVGSTPPTAEQFDALQRRSDTKAKDLNNRLSPLETIASKALARVTPAANRLPYFNSSNSATTTAISDFTKTLLDDGDAATARATLGAPSTTGANASGSWNINAATATKLSTARKINITGNASGSAAFDGSGDISISTTVNESKHAVNADNAGHANNVTDAVINYGVSGVNEGTTAMASGVIGNLSGLTGSNDLTSMNKLRSYIGSVNANSNWYDVISVRHRNGSEDGQNFGLLMYSGLANTDSIKYKKQPGSSGWTEERTLLDSSNYNNYVPTKTGTGASGTWNIGISGNAATASKLASPRAISLTGNASGSANFDGSGNVSINTTVNESKHAAAADVATKANDSAKLGGYPLTVGDRAYGTVPLVRPDGDMEIGKYIDWHATNDGIEDYSSRWEAKDDGTVSVGTINGALNGNAATATKLATPRAISLTGNASGSANFDGSGNVSINTTVNESKHAVNADSATQASKVYGAYTGAGGQQGPGYFGTNSAGCLMSNQPVNGHTEFKNWLYMDNYSNADDAGGASAIGVSRTEARAYIMGSNADRKQWDRTAELLSSANYNEYAPTKTGGGASGTWGINISGNAASATNADKLDGYHASDLLGKIYPVGSIYMSMSATNPATLFGVGTWKRISQGRMLLGADDSTYKAGATGGEATHTLTAAEMPAHSHGISTSGDHSHYFYGSNDNNGPFTEGDGLDTDGGSHFTRNDRFTTSSAGAHTHTISNSGGGAAHNNMPPYLVCYIWQRTA